MCYFWKLIIIICNRDKKTNMQLSGKTRTEHDLLGEMEIPVEYYHGIQTVRAVENFNISRSKLFHYPKFVNALADVKAAAAVANHQLGLLDEKIKNAIVQACKEIKDGALHEFFVVDMIQGGAGTSVNMNANEVIANRALEILGHEKGEYKYCHPNNHVNLSQSTNDAYPTALHLAVYNSIGDLIESYKKIVVAFRNKSLEFKDIIKMGRTQLQDAVPMTLDQEFEAFAVILEAEVEHLVQSRSQLCETNMGATAIGTGINSDPEYASLCTKHLADISGTPVVLADNLIAATSDTSVFVFNSSIIKKGAVKLSKISNDLRLLASGPRTGFGEINLPPMQPGSSIMPGKVNPVIPEVVNQIAFKVIGNDLTVSMASEAGQLQLNVMEPIIAFSILESIEILIEGIETLRIRCVEGITANEDRCRDLVMSSIGLVTAINPYLGYEASTKLASEALHSGRGVYDLVLESGLIEKEKLDDILKPENMVQPRKMN